MEPRLLIYVFFVYFLCGTTQAKEPEYKLSVAAIFQCESRFLKEWIDYNLLIGVEHFWLYYNPDLSEPWSELNPYIYDVQIALEPYINSGIVDLYIWDNLTPHVRFAFGCQAQAYQHALKRAKGKTKWLAIIDVDEFIVPLDTFTLTKTLDRFYDKASGVCVHWQMFGTSDVPFIWPQDLMIEQLTRKAVWNHPVNGWYKTIMKVSDVVTIENPHYPVYKKGKFGVNTAGNPNFQESEVCIKHLQINHYWTRDERHFNYVKIPRCEKRGMSTECIESRASVMNEVEDLAIQKYVPYLKKQ